MRTILAGLAYAGGDRFLFQPAPAHVPTQLVSYEYAQPAVPGHVPGNLVVEYFVFEILCLVYRPWIISALSSIPTLENRRAKFAPNWQLV